MKRRDILKSSALMLGYAVTGGAAVAVLKGCKADTSDGWMPSILTNDQVAMLAEVAETIIPATDTPGAKAAMVHRYIDEAVKANFTKDEQERFLAALPLIDAKSQEVGQAKFVDLAAEKRDAVLSAFAKEAAEAEEKDEQLFTVLKDLTVTGYFTSEIGATQALVYDPVPGPYKGCIPVSEVGGTYAL